MSTHLSKKANIVRRNVLHKIKKAVDRLPSQGPDPASSYKHGWRLASAAMVERYPIILPEMHPFEEEYNTGRFLYEQSRSKPMPKEAFLTERDRIEGRTEPSFNDPVAAQYVPGPRITEADKANDIRSLDRALAERLYFVVKSEKSDQYRFPQVMADKEEVSMIDFAERAVRAVTIPDSRPKIHFIAPRPACHLEHVFPVSYQQKYDVYGVKIFFYRAILLKGSIDSVRNAKDYAWARESELREMFGEEYFRAVQPALLGVGPSNDYDV